MYDISITFHQGTSREFGWDETHPTLQDAVDRLNTWATGSMICRAWINNKEVKVRNGAVIGTDGAAFCTNQAWHDVYAPLSYPKILRKQGMDNPVAQSEKAAIEEKARRAIIADKIVSKFVSQGLSCTRLDFED